MNELERRLRAAVRTNSLAATGTHAPRDTRRSIARRRGLTTGVIGGAVALVIGSVAVGGLGLDDTSSTPTPTPSQDLSIERGSLAYATIPLPDTTQTYREAEHYGERWCGQAPPEPTDAGGDFTATFDIPTRLNLDRSPQVSTQEQPPAKVSLTYDADDQLPAFGSGLAALVIDDGVVVGFTHDYQPPVVHTFKSGHTQPFSWRWDGWINSCEDDGMGSSPPAGEYHVVFVSRIHNDLATAAQWSLHLDNYMLPSVSDLEGYREGSFHCQQWQMWQELEPLTCHPNALVGFELDSVAGTATVPYDTSYYLRDVDFTFATAPVPATVVGENPWGFYEFEEAVYEPGAEIMCGNFYTQIGDTLGQLTGMWPNRTTLPVPGESLGATLWLWGFGWETAQFTVPQNPRIWLTRSKEVSEEVTEGDTTHYASYHGYEVVGWVDTESATTDPVEVFVYDGPGVWPLSATDAQWCDGAEPSATNTVDDFFGLEGLIAEPVNVTRDDSSTSEIHAVSLQIDPFQ